MATITTDNDFANALNQLIEEGQLTTVGERFVDRSARVVRDEADNSDITPTLQTLESALDRFATAQAARDATQTLLTLSRQEAIVYFRRELAAAAGSAAAIGALYTQARAYEQQNAMLTNTMLSLRTIRETSTVLNLNLTTNQGRATYLELFLLALSLWS